MKNKTETKKKPAQFGTPLKVAFTNEGNLAAMVISKARTGNSEYISGCITRAYFRERIASAVALFLKRNPGLATQDHFAVRGSFSPVAKIVVGPRGGVGPYVQRQLNLISDLGVLQHDLLPFLVERGVLQRKPGLASRAP